MPSAWVATSAETAYAALDRDINVDVAVVGGGITGLTTAFLLARSGARIALLERDRVALGTTGNTTAKITSLHRLIYADLRRRFGTERARQYGAANEAALAFIASLVRDEAIECEFGRAPAFTYTCDGARRGAVEREARAAADLGLPASCTTAVDLPFEVLAAVRFEAQAQFHPRKYCLALADRVVGRGGLIFERTCVTHVERGSPCRVSTAGGAAVMADVVVVATLLPFMDNGLFAARSEPARSYALGVRVGNAERVGGMYISAEEPTRSIRAHPFPGDDAYLIVGGEGHKTGHVAETGARYDALERWARDTFTVRSVEHRWSAQDYKTVDGVPYVGPLTRWNDRVQVATGFGKWGLTNGTAAAMAIAGGLQGSPPDWGEVFDSTRVAPRQSVVRFVRGQADVAARFVGDRLHARRDDPARLAAGEGAVFRRNGRLVAVCRGDDGNLQAVAAQCTHLGCIVRWNMAERSWDCPCHGSRFGADGGVLEGPAVRDLSPRDLA